jgi:cytochrome c oxidase cbb3-type subunit 3
MNDEIKDPLLLDHEVDGIRELDNKLPRWWVWLFKLTIAFAVAYLLYYHGFRAGVLSAEEYKAEMVVGNALKQKALAKFESGMAILQPSSDAAVIADGRNIFLQMCSPCHEKDGGGKVGPNLTDNYWIHGSNFVDNVKTIWNGVPEKGMLTWKSLLKPDQIYHVASYIYTLRGTTPKKPKPPENLNAAPTVNQYE